mmetsp:Transcript_1547/g.3325  ORF Transcript_1547/g.3325 Transcript_1547/m.3325 type:complete len:258 (+) Transcript_1547:739-1512(+)
MRRVDGPVREAGQNLPGAAFHREAAIPVPDDRVVLGQDRFRLHQDVASGGQGRAGHGLESFDLHRDAVVGGSREFRGNFHLRNFRSGGPGVVSVGPDVRVLPRQGVAGGVEEGLDPIVVRDGNDGDGRSLHVEGGHERPDVNASDAASVLGSLQKRHDRIGQDGHLEVRGPPQVVHHHRQVVPLLEVRYDVVRLARTARVRDAEFPHRLHHLLRQFVRAEQTRLSHPGLSVYAQPDLDGPAVQSIVRNRRSRHRHGA